MGKVCGKGKHSLIFSQSTNLQHTRMKLLYLIWNLWWAEILFVPSVKRNLQPTRTIHRDWMLFLLLWFLYFLLFFYFVCVFCILHVLICIRWLCTYFFSEVLELSSVTSLVFCFRTILFCNCVDTTCLATYYSHFLDI